MEKKKTVRKSFVITILDTQNATWQGTLIWIDKNETVHFRSALELIRMIDSALEGGRDGGETQPEERESDS